MQKEIKELKQRFKYIKNEGLHKSVCSGTTGLGQTFERLLGKPADTLPQPDYKGIEIKAKLGYSQTPMTLFCLTPKNGHGKKIDFLVDNYGYPDSSFSRFKILKGDASCFKTKPVAKRFYFNLKVDRTSQKLKLLIYDIGGNLLNDIFYWDFSYLEDRLVTKLSYMALVIGYPYNRNGDIYYRYFKMTFYRLKNFDCFLNLIEEGIITVVFNIGIYRDADRYGKLKDRGTAFKIDTQYLYKLFDLLIV